MKKALVLGASGGMGNAIVQELTSRGVEVIAFARTKSTMEKWFGNHPKVTIFAGDLFHMNDLQKAATGVDVIFQSANLPYSQWEKKLPLMMSNILNVAKNQSAKVACVDNIYAYGRSPGSKVKEDMPKNPHTNKGKIRLQIEHMIKESGVPALIAHFPDFYGPHAKNSLIHYTLQNVIRNKKASYVGDPSIAREFIYTPDGAKAIVNLAAHEHAYGQNWNIPAYDVISGEEIIRIVRNLTKYNKQVSVVTKHMIRFIGFFNANMREYVEMFYLNEEPVVLNGDKYIEYFGPVPRTPYEEGLKQTIEAMKMKEIELSINR